MRWLRQLATLVRVIVFGSVNIRAVTHAPMEPVTTPGFCVCKLELGHWRHGATGQLLAARPGAPR